MAEGLVCWGIRCLGLGKMAQAGRLFGFGSMKTVVHTRVFDVLKHDFAALDTV